MLKVLFLIHDLGHGGAEKLLVQLVNNMDHTQFDITLMSLFGGGVNERFLGEKVRYRAAFPRAIPGNSHLMKLLAPSTLHRWLIKERYDLEVAFLEGPSARIVSGCPYPKTGLAAWIHIEQKTLRKAAASFRSAREAMACYGAFDRLVAVSETVREDFLSLLPVSVPMAVLYNGVDVDRIRALARETVEDGFFREGGIMLVGVGKLTPTKGFDRLIRIVARLRREGRAVRLCLLGEGPEEGRLKESAAALGIGDAVCFPGYQINPYRYVARGDLFVCASYAEGFSTATLEALVVGTPVCTVEVAGMKEMLGAGEYGLVTENSEEALYEGLRRLLDEPELLARYREKARERGGCFDTQGAVRAVEDLLRGLAAEKSGGREKEWKEG